MIVVDASVATNMLAYADERGSKARAVLARDTEWVVPEHWKIEVFSALRGLTLGGKLTAEQGSRAVTRLPRLGVEQIPIDGLLPRMWQLRDAISGYAAAYVALAELRDLTLVTADALLARAASQHCRLELTS